MTKMHKILAAVLIAILGLVLITGGLLYYHLYQYEKTIKYWISTNSETINTGRKIRNYQNDDNFETITSQFYSNYTFVSTNLDLINPRITLVQENKSSTLIQFEVFQLKRNLKLQFDLEETYFGNIKNKSFTEAVEIAKKYDLSKENPDPENIIVQKPPTREEVEKNKQEDKIRQEKANNKELQAELIECSRIKEDVLIKYIKKDSELQGVLDYDKYQTEIGEILGERNECTKNSNEKYGYKRSIW